MHSENYGDSWQTLPFQFHEIQRAMIMVKSPEVA
jgi:hypothetical protein